MVNGVVFLKKNRDPLCFFSPTLSLWRVNISLCNVFSSRQSTNEDVQKAGEQTMVILYGGKKDDDLNILRHKKFCEKVASNVASIEPQALPPTSAAMKYHSYRVYYQICVWSERDSNTSPGDGDGELMKKALYQLPQTFL